MAAPRYYGIKKLLFRCLPQSVKQRRRIFTLAFDDTRDYFSQYGQDKFVDQVVFREERNGVFLDVGAYDGITASNSYFLERTRGWTGMCIEPLPEQFAKLRRTRQAICINGCAGLEDGWVDFLPLRDGNEMLSGRMGTFDAAQLERIKAATGGVPAARDVVRVRSYALPGLLRAHGLTRVDFLSLDTEGGELDLLKSLDLQALGVRAITIENNFGAPDIERYLTPRGYEVAGFMGCDEIYRRG